MIQRIWRAIRRPDPPEDEWQSRPWFWRSWREHHEQHREKRHMRGSTFDELRYWLADCITHVLRTRITGIIAIVVVVWVGWSYIKLVPAVLKTVLDVFIPPDTQDSGNVLDSAEAKNLRTSLRLVGLAGLIGAPFLIIRAVIVERQATTAENTREDQRLVKAMEQLGAEKTVKVSHDKTDKETTVERNAKGDKVKRTVKESRAPTQELTVPNVEVRLGAVALLEQISRDSARDHWGVMETFCAYLRNNGSDVETPPYPVRDKPREPLRGETNAQKEWRACLPEFGPIRREILLRISRRELRRIMRDERKYGPSPWFREQQPLPLDGVDLRGAKASGYDLRWADLRGARLQGADLSGAHLEGANLRRAHLEGANLRGAHLEGADLSGAHLEGADLSGAHLEGAKLRANLNGANLRGAYLEGAYLEGANLRGANLRGANLRGAYLEGAYLEGANLRRANLRGAYLEGVYLEGANLRGARLDEARDLTQEQINSTFGDETTTLPSEFDLHRPDHWPEGEEALEM